MAPRLLLASLLLLAVLLPGCTDAPPEEDGPAASDSPGDGAARATGSPVRDEVVRDGYRVVAESEDDRLAQFEPFRARLTVASEAESVTFGEGVCAERPVRVFIEYPNGTEVHQPVSQYGCTSAEYDVTLEQGETRAYNKTWMPQRGPLVPEAKRDPAGGYAFIALFQGSRDGAPVNFTLRLPFVVE